LFRKGRNHGGACSQLSNVLKECHPSHNLGVCTADLGGAPLVFCHKCGFYGQFRAAGLAAPCLCPKHKTSSGKVRSKEVVTGAGARHLKRIARGMHPDSHRPGETVSRTRHMLSPGQLMDLWGKVHSGMPSRKIEPYAPKSTVAGCGFDFEGDPASWFGEPEPEDDFDCPS
jgi:hypothetical protein